MARLARVVALDVAHHVTQRGNGRQFILSSDAERTVYLDLLRQALQHHPLSLRGYTGRPLGSTEFVKKLEHSTHRRLVLRKGGRPIYPTGSGFESMETHEISNVVKHEELHQAGESFVADLTSDMPGNVMDPASYDVHLEDRELKIDSYQGLELQKKFNRDNEVDSNPQGATCVGGCPPKKDK